MIEQHAIVARAPLVPELPLWLITEECALWHANEAQARAAGLPEPWWAFCWPGGQALARYVLDHPELVRGKRVLDFGSGSAVEAIAALKCGAASALAADLDPLAAEAAARNAALNDVQLQTTTADLLGSDASFDVVLAGDVFYDRDLAARALAWLRGLARRGALVLLGDPSRGWLDPSGLEVVATYAAGADGDVSGRALRQTQVFRVPGY